MSWDQIKDQVEKNGGVRTFTMGVLRDTHGAGKLGVNVCAQISENLAGIGLGHIPELLLPYQDEQVRLYKKGTPVGKLIDAVLSPGEQNDISLTERFADDQPDFAEMVQKIREIVGT